MLKRILILFVVLFLSVTIGLKVVDDPGYILLSYQKWTVEMPLWFGILATFIVFLVLYAIFRGFAFIGSLSGRFHRWLDRSRERHAHNLTTKGLIEFTEGSWDRAEKHLLKAVSSGENPLINYLAAARAAQEQGALHRRDKYLQKAHKAMPEAHIAVELSQAQLQIASRQFEQALASLRHLQTLAPKHVFVLKLLQSVYVELKDWEQLLLLMPDLKKYRVLPAQELERLEHRAYRETMYQITGDDACKTLTETWRSFPRAAKHNPEITCYYIECLINQECYESAESVIWAQLRKSFSDTLIHLYGETLANSQLQLTRAESLLKAHPNNPVLLLTLGKLSMRNKLWGKSRTYLENSIHHRPSTAAYRELISLFKTIGDDQALLPLYEKALDGVVEKE